MTHMTTTAAAVAAAATTRTMVMEKTDHFGSNTTLRCCAGGDYNAGEASGPARERPSRLIGPLTAVAAAVYCGKEPD